MSGSRSAEVQQDGVMRAAVRHHVGSGSPTSLEAALIARVLAGERDLFHDLVRPYERTIYLLTLRILRNAQEAEDVVQDTVLKALKNLHRFRAESKFSTWLISIAENEARTRLRRARVLRFESLDDNTEFRNHSFAPMVIADQREIPLQVLERTELRQMLQLAIACLPQRYRQTLLLRDVEELSIRETAAVLGVTEGVVKIRLFRARLMMQKILMPHHVHRLSAPPKRKGDRLLHSEYCKAGCVPADKMRKRIWSPKGACGRPGKLAWCLSVNRVNVSSH